MRRAKEGDLRSRQDELASATAERDAARSKYEGLRKARLDGFMAGAHDCSAGLGGACGARVVLGVSPCVCFTLWW